VGEIAPGVTCGGSDCVITVVAAGDPRTAAVTPIELTGAAGSGATATPSASPSSSADPSPDPTDTADPSPSATKSDKGNGGKNDSSKDPKVLPQTGPEEASSTLLFAIIALQLGLAMAWRFRDQRRRSAHTR
jgi:LPXTG-motif cell wall-anchored protein